MSHLKLAKKENTHLIYTYFKRGTPEKFYHPFAKGGKFCRQEIVSLVFKNHNFIY